MKISVIIPVYNAEKYLEAAVKSVLSQKGAEIEIIAIDDKSTDSSAAVLSSLAEKDGRIKAYYNEKNLGVAGVRNRALKYASGDFLAFCDSDDIVPDGAYAALLSVADGADIVAGGYDMLYDDGKRDGYCSVKEKDRRSSFSIVFTVCSLCTKLIRREFVEEHGITFDESMHIGEDVVFLARLVMKNPVCKAIDALVYHYCQHNVSDSRSLTHTYSFSAFEKHIQCKKMLLEICKNSEEAREYVYITSTPYITGFIPYIPEGEERNKAFSLYQSFLSEYDFSQKKALFMFLTGVPYENFRELSADRYIQIKNSYLPRERVLFEFENGKIGFRWIAKFFKGWLKFKLKRKKD